MLEPEFVWLQSLARDRANDVSVIWNSLHWKQKDEIVRKLGIPEGITSVDIPKYFPELAVYLLGGLFHA